MEGYTTSVTGDMRTGFTITNTKETPAATSADPEDPQKTAKTGDDVRLLFVLLAMIISGGGIAYIGLISRRRGNEK